MAEATAVLIFLGATANLQKLEWATILFAG